MEVKTFDKRPAAQLSCPVWAEAESDAQRHFFVWGCPSGKLPTHTKNYLQGILGHT